MEGEYCERCLEELGEGLQEVGERKGHSYEARNEDGSLMQPDLSKEMQVDLENLTPNADKHENAKCGVAGKDVYECDDCDVAYEKTLPALEHDANISAIEPANCHHNALSVKKCSKCSEIQGEGEDLVEKLSLDEATAARLGYLQKKHDWKLTPIREATCTQAGLGVYECQQENCEDVRSDVIPPHHAYQDAEGNVLEDYGVTTSDDGSTVIDDKKVQIISQANCTKKGLKVYTCSACEETDDGHTLDVETEPFGHVFEEKDGYVEETWEKACQEGKRIYTCTRENCDEINNTYIETIDPKEPHKYETETKPATCTTPSVTGEYCETCGQVNEDVALVKGEKAGHSYEVKDAEGNFVLGVSYQKDANGNVYLDGNGEVVVIVPEGFGEDGSATRKGKYEVTSQPTCTEIGTVSITCLACQEHQQTTLEIPALGHVLVRSYVPATCLSVGKWVYTCSRCKKQVKIEEVEADKIDKVNGHKWVVDEEKSEAATCTQGGTIVRICSLCNEDGTIKTAPAHNWAPAVEVRDGENHLMGMTRTCQGECKKTEAVFVEDEYLFCENCQKIVEPSITGARPAVCGTEGQTGRMICPDCTTVLKESEAIPALEHDYKQVTPEFAADWCGSTYKQYVCQNPGCPNKMGEKTDIVPPSGKVKHTYTDKVEIIEATSCQDVQKVVRICDKCGEKDETNAMEVEGTGLPHEYVQNEDGSYSCKYGCNTPRFSWRTTVTADAANSRIVVNTYDTANDKEVTIVSAGLLYSTSSKYVTGTDLDYSMIGTNGVKVLDRAGSTIGVTMNFNVGDLKDRKIYARPYIAYKEKGSDAVKYVYDTMITTSFNEVAARR